MLKVYNQGNSDVMIDFRDGTHIHIPRFGSAEIDVGYENEMAVHKAHGVNITFHREEVAKAPAKTKLSEPVKKEEPEKDGDSEEKEKDGEEEVDKSGSENKNRGRRR